MHADMHARQPQAAEAGCCKAQEISKVVGEWWSKTSDEDKAPYVQMAAEDKARFQREMDAFQAKRQASFDQQQLWVTPPAQTGKFDMAQEGVVHSRVVLLQRGVTPVTVVSLAFPCYNLVMTPQNRKLTYVHEGRRFECQEAGAGLQAVGLKACCMTTGVLKCFADTGV